MYKNKKFFVLGMARSGYEVSKLLAKDNIVFVTDMKEQDSDRVKELENLGVKVVISDNPIDLLDDSFDIMVKNPGIKYNHPCVVKAKELGMPVINEVEVAYHYLDKDVNIIGVTGSNGKTTTVSIIYEIMKKAFGNRVFLAGNIGTPLCHFVSDIKSGDYLVMEISDHQLCDMYEFKTNVSVMTNIFDCHADFHDGHERYVLTKKKIFMNHTDRDVNIINKANKEEMGITKDIRGINYYFNGKDAYYKDGFIYFNGKKIIDTKRIILKGMHNYENIMCAILATKVYGVSDSIIQSVVSSFSGVEHRLEFVGNINGRDVYNDSKSTNTESTVIALNSFDRDTVLIMGGLDRGHSFDALTKPLKHTKLVVCYGETKDRIRAFCHSIGIKCIVCDDLVHSVKVAYDNSKKGDVILFSPACASWDQFPDFETRGKLFKDTILKYKDRDTGLFLDKSKHIYMMGIGGISMSGIADILVNMGYTVSGSDRTDSVIIDKLRDNGIKVFIPQSSDNITSDIDFIVYTAAIKSDNVEMIRAKELNIPMMERGEFLGEITKLYSNTIGVSGTHGKTTTTSMLSCIFLEGDFDPTIQVGSILSNIGGNYRVGKSDTLIIEACEYSDSFLNFKQKSAIVLNIDSDHLDYFKNLDNIKKSFYEYVSHLPSDGCLVINNDDKNSHGLELHTKAKVLTYGIVNDSDFMASNIVYDKDGNASFDVTFKGDLIGNVSLSVAGYHNVSNALAAIGMAYFYGISFSDIKRGLSKYKGASRRLEYKGKFNGASVYDDYGHHPTEINAVVEAIMNKKFNESWVIFEPHTYSRTYQHKEAFAKALSKFDHIIIIDIYAARERNVYGITEEDIVKEIKKYGKEAFHISNYDDIVLYLKQYVKKDDLIITLGAGNVTKISDMLVNNV